MQNIILNEMSLQGGGEASKNRHPKSFQFSSNQFLRPISTRKCKQARNLYKFPQGALSPLDEDRATGRNLYPNPLASSILTGRQTDSLLVHNHGGLAMKKLSKATVKHRTANAVLKLIALEKSSFAKVTDRLGSLQARADKAIQKRVESSTWLPKEGKQLMSEWMQTAKKGRSDLRKTVDVTFDLTSDFVKRVALPPVKTKKRAPVARKKSTAHAAAA